MIPFVSYNILIINILIIRILSYKFLDIFIAQDLFD